MSTQRTLRRLAARWCLDGQPEPSVALYRRRGFFGREVWTVEVQHSLGSPPVIPANATTGHDSARAALRAALALDPEKVRRYLRGETTPTYLREESTP